MADLSYDDVVNIFQGCLLVRKGSLVKFEEAFVYEDRIKVRLFNLNTRKMISVLFRLEDYKAPESRIGYVNEAGNAVFIRRQPRRLYKAGLHNTNVDTIVPPRPDSGEMVRHSAMSVMKFTSKSILDAYHNKYPTLADALVEAKANESAIAFDKQFAVSHFGSVFYKSERVGIVEGGAIKFNDGKEYLSTLLDGNYEKDSRNFAARPL